MKQYAVLEPDFVCIKK